MIEVAPGVTRTVFLIGRWAVKVPRLVPSGRGVLWSLAHGILANLSEVEWSEMDGVCPPCWSLLGLVNVYPRCEPVDGPVDFAAIADPAVPVDPKLSNVGVLDGRLVWIDYADAGECVACARFRGEHHHGEDGTT